MCIVYNYYFEVNVTKHWMALAYIVIATLVNWMLWTSFLIAYPKKELIEAACFTNALIVTPFAVKWYLFCSRRTQDTLLI